MDRSAGLCWGQRYVWLNHHQLPPGARHEVNLTISVGPGAGTTVESLRLGLDLLARRHEGLRSTYPAWGGDGPVQRVHPPGPVPVVCIEADDHSPVELAALLHEVTAADFDLEREWPVRACIVTESSVPRRMVTVVHHTAMDDWSMETLKREADEIQESIISGRRAALGPVRHHPVDLARYEASQQAADLRRRARGYWDRTVAQMPADLFAGRRIESPPDGPASLSASLSSPKAMAAAGTVASRHGVWPSTVYTAAFGVLLAAYTGSAAVPYRTYAANRQSAPHAEAATCVFQPVLVNVDCSGGPTFADLLDRTATGCAAALDESARGPYDELLETVARHSGRRGVGIRTGTVFNHLRYPTKTRGGARTIVNRNPEPWSWSLLGDDLYLRVCEWRDCVVATLNAGATIMTADGAERFLRGFEALLVSAADGAELRLPDVRDLAGFDAPPHGAPVDPGEVARCLAECAGVRAARVFARHPAADGSGLTAYVTSGDPVVGPGELRTHLLGRLYDRPRLACPDRFVVCAGNPDDPDDAGSWAALPVLAAGTGADQPTAEPADEPQRALRDAVRAANGLDHVDLARSYVEAGGRVMNIAHVQRTLRDQGWTGPGLYDFASARPLRALAARVEPVRVTLAATVAGSW